MRINKKDCNNEAKYISLVVEKTQFSYQENSLFFIFLSIGLLAMNGATIIFKTSIFHKIYNENLNFTQNLSALNMAQFCFQTFLTLLLLLGIFIFRHKYKKKRGESIWLF